MSEVDRLFDQYREQHRSGGGADPRPFLEQLEGVDQRELAALIGGYLERAPGRTWNAAGFAGSAAERLTERLAADWEQAETPVAWTELLPQLRHRAQIKRAELVARLAEAIGAGDQTEKVAAYYHQMETGRLPSEGVSNRVLRALGEIVDESAERLRAAGSVIGAGGDAHEVETRVAFARTAVHNPEYSDEVARRHHPLTPRRRRPTRTTSSTACSPEAPTPVDARRQPRSVATDPMGRWSAPSNTIRSRCSASPCARATGSLPTCLPRGSTGASPRA